MLTSSKGWLEVQDGRASLAASRSCRRGADATEANEAVLRLNKVAGNVGRTVIPGERHALSSVNTHAEVLDAIRSADGAVVFLHHVDPAYNLPGPAPTSLKARRQSSVSRAISTTQPPK